MRTDKWTEVTLDLGDKIRVRGPGVVFELTADDRGEDHEPRCRTYADIRADNASLGKPGLSVDPFGKTHVDDDTGCHYNGVTVVGVSN